MTVPVPPSVESRVRRRWSRRAKLIGLGLLALYVSATVILLLARRGIWAFVFVGSGIGLAIKYLRAGEILESRNAHADDETKKLVRSYEEKIQREGQREVAQGTLSVSTVGDDGDLSFTDEPGGLSPSDPNRSS